MATSSPSSDEATRQFTLWALEQLELKVSESEGLYRVTLPEDQPNAFAPGHAFDFRFGNDGLPHAASREDQQRASASVDVLDWLIEQLHSRESEDRTGMLHARPKDQPASVHEIADAIFSAYRIDGGSVHLAGCSLDDRPFLRMTYFGAPGGDEPLCHQYLDAEGEPVPDQLVTRLHLDNLVPLAPAEVAARHSDEVEKLKAVSRRTSEDWRRAQNGRTIAPAATTAVWCKFAEIKLQFTIGEATADLAFRGWASTLEAPPFVCPYTGAAGYHLAATDDGAITLAGQIGVCALSGRRVLQRNLVLCAATGKQVLPDYACLCPVCRQPVIATAMEQCAQCQQEVSPTALEGGICQACLRMKRVPKDDPRVAGLLSEYPALDGWRQWKIAETAKVYVLLATSLLRRLLIVVDKSTFRPQHVAVAGRLFGVLRAVKPSDYDRVLTGSTWLS